VKVRHPGIEAAIRADFKTAAIGRLLARGDYDECQRVVSRPGLSGFKLRLPRNNLR
jgi:hypothetical protein